MPDQPSLDTLLGLACKGDRAAADLATRMLTAHAGADPIPDDDPSLLAWLERRNRRSRRRGRLRTKGGLVPCDHHRPHAAPRFVHRAHTGTVDHEHARWRARVGGEEVAAFRAQRRQLKELRKLVAAALVSGGQSLADFGFTPRERTPQPPAHGTDLYRLLRRALSNDEDDDADRASIELYLQLLDRMQADLPGQEEHAPCLVATLMLAMTRRLLLAGLSPEAPG